MIRYRITSYNVCYTKLLRIRVKLDDLTQDDFEKILTQPENAVTKQYTALLSADKVKLSFSQDALREIAKFAYLANENSYNFV